jgi:hypothetical protein
MRTSNGVFLGLIICVVLVTGIYLFSFRRSDQSDVLSAHKETTIEYTLLPTKSNNIDISKISMKTTELEAILVSAPIADLNDGICHPRITQITPPPLPAVSRGFPLSDFWIDGPDAKLLISRQLTRGMVSQKEHDDLVFFIDNGYLIIDLSIPENVFHYAEEFMHEIWQSRPDNILISGGGN